MIDALTHTLRSFEPLRRAVVALRDARSAWIDRSLGIATTLPRRRARMPVGRRTFADSRQYEAIDYGQLEKFLAPLALGPSDVAYDIGCGLGRIVCVLGRRRLGRVVGVELDDELAAGARANAAALAGRRSPIEIIAGDAAGVDYRHGTVFIFFNPFGPATLKATLDRIRDSLRVNPRRVRLGYFNPVHEDVLAKSGWLERTGEARSARFRYHAAYWQSSEGR